MGKVLIFGKRRVAAAVLAAFCFAGTGCRIDEDDVRRWETTRQGPEKLKAVLYHEKYEIPLRVEAALSLIRMKQRGGRHIGIPILIETMAETEPDARQAIVARLIPAIVNELNEPPPVAQAGGATPPDGSFPYKDAAYAMLTHDKTVLVADETLKASLEEALIKWAIADFEHRLVNRTQSFGMEQLLRYLGARSVADIPSLMTQETTQLDKMSGLVADLGDDATKQKASEKLVGIATYTISEDWVKKKTPELQAANAASKLEPTEKQFAAQLKKFQDEEFFRVLASMKRVGGRPTVDFGLDFAAKKEQDEKRRQAALAALEGQLDRKNQKDLDRILAIATSDAPDPVLDQAFRRIGEMPRESVVGKLYKMFEGDKWKVRRAAASTVLKMSKVEHINEFFKALPPGDGKGFAMAEAITYGAQLGDLKEGKPLDKIAPFMNAGTGAQRATAISYLFSHGKPSDIPKLEGFANDKQPLPECDTDDQCKWACYVPKEGAKDANDKELKDVKTVADFASLCVIPAIRERAAREKAAKEAGEADPKDDKKKEPEKEE